MLREKESLLAQKQELEKTIFKQNTDNSFSDDELKLKEKKMNLETKLKENFNQTNKKVEMLEKIEDNIFQEVVRPEKVINPKKL